MLYGTVRYVLKAEPGKEVEVPWAGRVVFDDAEELKMKFYQVYLVGSSLALRDGDGMGEADVVYTRIRLRSPGRSDCILRSGGKRWT
jgi:hypothetical protein